MRTEELQSLAVALRDSLVGLGFHHADIGRDLGKGTAFPATADIAGGLQDRDRLFRTDLGFLCFYDLANTQWLTAQVFEVRFSLKTFSATLEDTANLQAMPADYKIFAIRLDVTVNTGATNTGANYWAISWRDGATNTIATTDTSALAAATSRQRLAVVAGFSQPAAVSVFHNLLLTKNGAPSNIDMYAVCRYRLIIT